MWCNVLKHTGVKVLYMFIQILSHPISLLILWVMSNCAILESAYRLAVKIMVCVGDQEFFHQLATSMTKTFIGSNAYMAVS